MVLDMEDFLVRLLKHSWGRAPSNLGGKGWPPINVSLVGPRWSSCVLMLHPRSVMDLLSVGPGNHPCTLVRELNDDIDFKVQ